MRVFSSKTVGFICLVVSGAMLGCAGFPATKMVKTDPQPQVADKQYEGVRAVQLESPTSDGQTTWRIEPAASWMPQRLSGTSSESPHIERRLQYAFDLAQRGATYSAKMEFRATLALCALELDASSGSEVHRAALKEAITALNEAEEFVSHNSDSGRRTDVTAIAMSHSTRQHFEQRDHEVDDFSAVRAYYAFAEERLEFACGNMPSASLALYGLGRIQPLLGGDDTLSSARAVLFHRAALVVNESNTLAANELGVLLVHHGQLVAAEQVFERAAAGGDSSDSVDHNLAVVRDRLGNRLHAQGQAVDLAKAAGRNSMIMAEQQLPTPNATISLNANEGTKNSGSVVPTGHESPAADETRSSPKWRTAWERIPKLSTVFRR